MVDEFLCDFVFVTFANRKYEEVKPPEVEDFCFVTDNTYSKEEVILVFHLLLVLLLSLTLGFANFCNFFGEEGFEYGSRYIDGVEI